MTNLIKRTVPVILVLFVCITCLVSPVSAVSESTMYELLDYSSADDTGKNYLSFAGTKSVEYDLPQSSIIRYIDMTISMVGAISSVYVGDGSTFTKLNVEHIENDFYRVYGESPSIVYGSLIFKFESGSTSHSWYTIFSLKVSPILFSSVPSIGRLNVWDSIGGNTTISMSSPSDEPEIYLSQAVGSTVSTAEFITTVYLDEWKKYNYLDVVLYCDVEHINSLFVRQGDLFLDYDVSYLTPADQINTYYWIMVHIDLSAVDLKSSTVPNLVITGTYYNQVDYNKILLKSITGLIDLPEPNRLLAFWYNFRSFLSSNFDTLFSKIDEAFGLNDESASFAQQTQEEINVSVNNQLVGAVEDWNTNIEVVQTGYDSALTKATPALGWLASLADRIFTNMGWFGNIYFLVGLISVIMLVLSKSGLARSVSRFRRNE